MSYNAVSLVVIFALGFIARKKELLQEADSRVLIRLAIFFTLPATSLRAFTNPEFSFSMANSLLLPLLGFFIPLLLLLLLALPLSRLLVRSQQKTKTVFLCSATVANLGFFLYPFFEARYGAYGLAQLVLFDVGNTLMAYTITHYITLRDVTVDRNIQLFRRWKRIILFPPLWAAIIGVTYSYIAHEYSLSLPAAAVLTLDTIARANAFLVMFVLGLRFHPVIPHPALTVAAISVRMLGGAIIGILFAFLFELDGILQTVVIVAAGMPVGMTTLVYALEYDLDAEYAAALVALSSLVGFLAITLIGL